MSLFGCWYYGIKPVQSVRVCFYARAKNQRACFRHLPQARSLVFLLKFYISASISTNLYIGVPSQQKWTQKSFKKRNESQYFVNLLKSTALFHGLLAGDLCRHDVPAKERSSQMAIRPGTSLSYRLLIVKQLSRHKR